MRNLILKMVQEGVVTSEDADKILQSKKNVDPIWRALSAGTIDEKKLAKFYEQEGYPVIYDESMVFSSDDFFTRFFTPDVIARLLAVPISFKKESKDIIIGFINLALIPQIREAVSKIFFGFNTTFFHIPYSIFKKIAAKRFFFDVDKFIAILSQMETSDEIRTDQIVTIVASRKKLREFSDEVYMLEIDADESVVFKKESIASRFPLQSLPIFKEGFNRGYVEFVPGDNINSLNHTEKILLFTNIGIKKEDKVVIIAANEEKKKFFLLLNPRAPKEQIEFIVR